jgi:UDP-2,3-diacylglucosamine pyrophosphatase LpxH
MTGTKRIFISDIHLSSKARYTAEPEIRRARFKPEEHEKRLVNFLDKSVLEKETEIKDLVLAGDILDTWVCPPDEAPPTFKEIFDSNPEFMNALRAIAKSRINLYYLPGNHDHLCKKNGYKIVIFGHTHKAKIDKDSFLVADRIYANAGCWSQKKAHCVMVDKTEKGKARVKLCKVISTGRPVLIEKEKIKL